MEFPEVKNAYDKYMQKFNLAPTNPTQLIKFCQKNEIQGVTWSKCSKYFKLLNGQSITPNKSQPPKNFINKSRHQKTTSGPLLSTSPKSSSSLSSSSTTNGGNSINNNNNDTKTTKNGSSPMVSPKLSASNHRRTQSAIDAKTHKANIDKKKDISTPFQTVMINDLFTDLKEDPNGPKDEDSKSAINGNTKTSSLMVPNNKKQVRFAKTPPPTSFKSIFVDQKLGAFHETKESAPVSTIEKTVKKEIKKHPLLEKPWNKHKSSTWPKNRYMFILIFTY